MKLHYMKSEKLSLDKDFYKNVLQPVMGMNAKRKGVTRSDPGSYCFGIIQPLGGKLKYSQRYYSTRPL